MKNNFVPEVDDVVKALRIRSNLESIKKSVDNMINIEKNDFDKIMENISILNDVMTTITENYLKNIKTLIIDSQKSGIKIPEYLFPIFESAVDTNNIRQLKLFHSELEELILVG